MSAFIEGLLGAVMGGAQEYGNILKEEETAKRKEEEEKRREERAFTLAERKADAEQKRKQTLDEQERARVSKMLGPETRMTPGANPMEPEGIVESKIPIEERLQAGMQKAMSEGDTKTAKALLDQFQGIEEVKRKAAEEARKGEPKKEEPSAEFKTRMATIQAAYPGKKDEGGKPIDKEDYDKYVRAEFGKLAAKDAYIKPEHGAGGPKPLSMAAEDAQQGKVKKLITDISTDQVGKAKVKNTAKENALGQILSDYQGEVAKANPDDPQAFYRIDLNTVERELRGRLKTAQDAAASEAGAKFTEYRNATKAPKETDEQFKARKEAILPNQLHRAFADNKKSTKDVFVEAVKDDFLSSAPKSQTAEPATIKVDFNGKPSTARLAPDGKYYVYDEETKQYFLYRRGK